MYLLIDVQLPVYLLTFLLFRLIYFAVMRASRIVFHVSKVHVPPLLSFFR
jgi:hypothetical protein